MLLHCFEWPESPSIWLQVAEKSSISRPEVPSAVEQPPAAAEEAGMKGEAGCSVVGGVARSESLRNVPVSVALSSGRRQNVTASANGSEVLSDVQLRSPEPGRRSAARLLEEESRAAVPQINDGEASPLPSCVGVAQWREQPEWQHHTTSTSSHREERTVILPLL